MAAVRSTKTGRKVVRSSKTAATSVLATRTRIVTDEAGSARQAAELLGVNVSQVSRWARGESIPGTETAATLIDVDHVLAHAALVWGDRDVARSWLRTPNDHLDGVAPIDLIRRGRSAEVVDALRAEAAGAYA